MKKGTKLSIGHKCFDRFKGANQFKLYMEFRVFIRYVIDSSNNNGNTFGDALLPPREICLFVPYNTELRSI